MGTTDISDAKNPGDPQDESWYNDFRSALLGAVVGRDPSSGEVASGEDIGSAVNPWGALYATSLVIGGTTIDLGSLTGDANSILSGQAISTSIRPDFLRASGAAATVTVEAATTSLVLNVDSVSTTISADLVETGLTVAPSTNNTATVNDAGLTGQESSKWQGEDGTVLTITSAGTEITNRIGQYAVFKTSTEYMLAYIESATELTNVYRGYFLDSSGVPIERVAISNSDTLTIMSGGWVFVEDDSITVDVTYTSPIYSLTEPGSPATGDYWFDLTTGKWKRYGGATFAIVKRIPLGIAVIDATNCVATRSFDLAKIYEAFNPIGIEYDSATVISATDFDFDINVYGVKIETRHTEIEWDIATDLESGVTEGASTTYFAYITETGKTVLSDKKPYDSRGTLEGWYHPYNSWKAIGLIFNNGSSNFDSTTLIKYTQDRLGSSAQYDAGTDAYNMVQLDGSAKIPAVDASQTTGITASQISGIAQVPHLDVITATGTWTKPSNVSNVKVTVVGGGGGGGTSAGAGGSTSFGAFCSATGGAAGSSTSTAAGGIGSGGDINIRGASGGGSAEFGDALGGIPQGGSSILGGGGTGGASGTGGNYGGGGGGYGGDTGGAGNPSTGGGGGGGAAIEVVAVTGNVSVTIGAGGTAGTSGGAGAAGVVMVEYMDTT